MDKCFECGREVEQTESVMGDQPIFEKHTEGNVIKWKLYCKDCAKKLNIKQ